jgi:small basic protein
MAAYASLDLVVAMVDECAEHTKDHQVKHKSLCCLFVLNVWLFLDLVFVGIHVGALYYSALANGR